MGIYRLYTGSDGQSHIDNLNLTEELTSPHQVTSFKFMEWPAGHFIDWHPAPQRQYVISLSGELEIGLGNGVFRRFNAGDTRLVEDITGQGHTTRVVGDEPVLTAVVPLATNIS